MLYLIKYSFRKNIWILCIVIDQIISNIKNAKMFWQTVSLFLNVIIINVMNMIFTACMYLKLALDLSILIFWHFIEATIIFLMLIILGHTWGIMRSHKENYAIVKFCHILRDSFSFRFSWSVVILFLICATNEPHAFFYIFYQNTSFMLYQEFVKVVIKFLVIKFI